MTDKIFSHVECGHCREAFDTATPHSLCDVCDGPLLARYDLTNSALPTLDEVVARPASQFRFHEVLPTDAGAGTPTLGEGATPLIPAPGLGPGVVVKDEAQNPTGSFKARGMAVAMARAVELGLKRFALPSNGNAGGAAAAYGALHGVEVEVVVPTLTPQTLIDEPRAHGATVTTVDGTIADAGAIVADLCDSGEVFNLSTLKEPFRIEGKKMMGYELFWDLEEVPDVVVYPTGGGTGLIGMVKAFDEMDQIGWIGSSRPRFVAVQVDGCAPIVKAFHDGSTFAAPWKDAAPTSAYGLRVPSAVGDRLMLEGLRRTNGTAVAVSEDEMLEATDRLADRAGIWGSPEGGACVAAVRRLVDQDWIKPGETTVIFNTATATKYR